MTMVNPNINSFFKPQGIKNPGETELGLFYANDMHGDLYRLSKFKTAHDTFTKQNKNIPSMTLAAGDCLFGADKARSTLMVKLFNMMKLDALALGNHEFAAGSKNLAENLEKAEFKSVSANLEIEETNSLSERLKDKKLVKSAIFMKGGHKFAVIGASPINSYIGNGDKGVKPMDIEKTINAINEEAKNIEKQGVNKIILCSHLGYGEDADLKVARETEGIDIIVGGHTHTKINGVNQDMLNLVNSKRNEPVIITQAGGMNEKVGFLNVLFDEKGVIKSDTIVNKLANVEDFAPSKEMDKLMDKELGEKISLAKVKTPYLPKGSYYERRLENPLANHFADAILDAGKKYGAEISLFQAASVRGGMNKEITNYDVKYSMLPFNSELKVIDITEKDLVNVLNNSSGSLLTSNEDAQLMRCSGMEYSVRNDKDYFKSGNKDGLQNLLINGHSIDVKNPSETKTIKAVINSYLFDCKNTKETLAKYKDFSIAIGHEQEIFINYLKNLGEIDYDKNEKRINLSTGYNGWDAFETARKDVISTINKTLQL